MLLVKFESIDLLAVYNKTIDLYIEHSQLGKCLFYWLINYLFEHNSSSVLFNCVIGVINWVVFVFTWLQSTVVVNKLVYIIFTDNNQA